LHISQQASVATTLQIAFPAAADRTARMIEMEAAVSSCAAALDRYADNLDALLRDVKVFNKNMNVVRLQCTEMP
jgi:hypothetical protein